MIGATAMLPQAAAANSTTSSTSSSGLPSSQSLDGMFLQLLVAQLQNQDPTSPLDPSQFVGQLAQFSELSEVTQIAQLLQQALANVPGTGGTAPPAAGAVLSRSSSLASAANVPAASPAILPSTMISPGASSINLPSVNPFSVNPSSVNLSSAATAAQSALPNLSSPATSFLKHRIEGVF